MMPLHQTFGSDEAASSTTWVDETIDLAAIFDAHVNVVVLRRRSHHALAGYATKLARDHAFQFKATATFQRPEGLDALDELADQLPPDDARDVLIADLAYWVEVMSELTGSPRVGVRLTCLDAPMCPRFHVDHVTLRLVCTYAGASSEWLDERDLDRALLDVTGLDGIERAIRCGAKVRSCAPLDVVLFKGTAWPTPSGRVQRGAIHRSPSHSPTPRLLLTIDPLG
jgi:Protein of unknown function (DUF1826)